MLHLARSVLVKWSIGYKACLIGAHVWIMHYFHKIRCLRCMTFILQLQAFLSVLYCSAPLSLSSSLLPTHIHTESCNPHTAVVPDWCSGTGGGETGIHGVPPPPGKDETSVPPCRWPIFLLFFPFHSIPLSPSSPFFSLPLLLQDTTIVSTGCLANAPPTHTHSGHGWPCGGHQHTTCGVYRKQVGPETIQTPHRVSLSYSTWPEYETFLWLNICTV